MEIPDLTQIVDTYMPIADLSLDSYLVQLRRELVPHIRQLQTDGLRWYSFLIHGPEMLDGRVPSSGGNVYIHLRLEPKTGADIAQFIAQLPAHFQKPQQMTLANIGGVDGSILRDQNWAYAWNIHGEASEWVVSLLEGHANNRVTIQQIVQFMHFITNPLMLGHRCLCIPAGFLSF